MIAKVVRTKGGKVLDEIPFDNIVVEGAIRDRDEQYGVNVHAFEPRGSRDWWLITWPLELKAIDAAEQLFRFAIGMGLDYVDFPDELDDPYVWAILNQPVVFEKILTADGTYVDAEPEGIGHRFGMAS